MQTLKTKFRSKKKNGSTFSRTHTTTKLEDYISQTHLVGPMALWPNKCKRIISLIMGSPRNWQNHFSTNYSTRIKTSILYFERHKLWGKRHCDVIEKAKQSGGLLTKNPIYFIDEIHRFSKSQQDSPWPRLGWKGTDNTNRRHHRKSKFEVTWLYFQVVKYVLNALAKGDLESLP
jgi:replication-associated recombination protein RarA